MISIHAEPASLKTFLKPIRNFFEGDVTSYYYAWRFIVGLAFLFSHKSEDNISKLLGAQRTRQSYDNFFNKRDWDCQSLLRRTAKQTLKSLGWKEGDPLYLALDDTQNEKRAFKMEAVSKIFLHAEKRYAKGHILVACAIIYREVAIPYGIKIWVGKNNFSNLAMKYGWTNRQTINELAAELIRSLDVTKKTKVTVVFDKYYLNQKVIKACN